MRIFRTVILSVSIVISAVCSCFGAVKPDTTTLRTVIKNHLQQDTVRVNLLNKAGFLLYRNKAAESHQYYVEALSLSKKLHFAKGEAGASIGLGFYHRFRGEYAPALSNTLNAIRLYVQLRDTLNQLASQYNLVSIYRQSDKLLQSVAANLAAINLADLAHSKKWIILFNNLLGTTYVRIDAPDKALLYITTALAVAESTDDLDGIQHCYSGLGDVYRKKGEWVKARHYYELGAALDIKVNNRQGYTEMMLLEQEVKILQGDFDGVLTTCYGQLKSIQQAQNVGDLPLVHTVLSFAYLRTGHADSAIKYGLLSLRADQVRGEKRNIISSSNTLAEAYAAMGQFKEAYHYQKMFSDYSDSLNDKQSLHRVDAIQYSDDLDKKQSQIKLLKNNTELISKESRQQKILLIFSIALIVAAIVFSAVLLQSNRQRLAANRELQRQQDELKATQNQLVQSEKMASLGELTAGIAHEIQNPLNFVNNFSEVNRELLEELKSEIDGGNLDEVKAIADDVIENEKKISQHGKRADAIVKGMLQHSRAGSGLKEPTDINALADEYIRLSYHGLRAKDKSFNADMVCKFDKKLPKADVVPQDVGRVLLNLFNNAFYAVNQKQKTAGPDYKPEVSVITFTENNHIVIKVKDNGVGIPEALKAKIMQPFFTTKPTGEGTGLGLSLAYDMLVKGNNGTITVDSKEGEWTEFIIAIPVNQV